MNISSHKMAPREVPPYGTIILALTLLDEGAEPDLTRRLGSQILCQSV